MKTAGILALIILICAGSLYSDTSIPRYHDQYDFLLASPASMGFGLYGYANPAVLGQVEKPDLLFGWRGTSDEFSDFDRWGVFGGLPMLGFGVIKDKSDLGQVWDYRLGTAFGGKGGNLGISYGWTTGDESSYGRSSMLSIGTLMRPCRRFSVGISGSFATRGTAREYLFDLGIRPLGNEILTLFGDYAPQTGDTFKKAPWSTGLVLEALPGVRLTGRYFSDHQVTLGLNFSLARVGLSAQGRSDTDRKHSYNTYAVRVGAMDRNVFRAYGEKDKKYLHMSLTGPVKYQRYRLFDESRTFSGVLDAIDAAKHDDTIAGIAINTSGMIIGWEMAWEVREALKKFQAAGKHVVVFIDDASLPRYHFASVADKIVLDPTGEVSLLGFRAGRLYLKGSLDKLGIGFDELRFFKYKSAYESYSRESMSEGDAEQLQAIIDDFYALSRSDICEGRGISHDEFDRMVNEEVWFPAKDALEAGLVDTLGRWEAVRDVIKGLEGKSRSMVGAGNLARYELPGDDYWGEKPKVAVIYGLGVCAMDTGIKARSLERVFDSVANNNQIKAVVFRVDSPGGSATASDVVAEAIKRCQRKKPVVVSQGWLAGSGGYWISMYADTIVAAPNSITGSIGVIGGWFYNKGLKQKLGMTTDLVTVGDHADLGYGVTLPFLGRLPDRDFTDEERARVEDMITTFYYEFVDKVAEGRGMESSEVDSIGQGRVWSGTDGLKNGLVDVLGGMETAIMLARERAGIAPEDEVEIVELPEPPLFSFPAITPRLFGIEQKEDPLIEHLKFRLDRNGEVMPIVPGEYLDPELQFME
ncbi:MAG: S49 family peptidase [bacterium]|jgi:protease-4